MTTLTLKQIYESDLLVRFPTHAFSETTVGSTTRVEFTVTDTIDSVSDSSSVARFVFTSGPTLIVGQEVTISGFVTNTAYNITGNITATDGTGYFEISSIAWGSSETVGSFIALVAKATKLDVGDAYKNIRENVVGAGVDQELHTGHDIIQTTDNTVTTINTIALDDEAEYVIEATLLGIESDNSNRAAYRILGVFYRTGAGNAIQVSSTDSVFSKETAASWTGGSFSVSGNNVLVEVQGAASTTINWESIVTTLELE